MAEPPEELGRPRRPSLARRAGAVAGFVMGLGILAVVVLVLSNRGDDQQSEVPVAAAPAESPAEPAAVETPPETLKIVFPEGFTRLEMEERIVAVNEIAEEERGLTTSLKPKTFRQASKVLDPPIGFEDVEPPHLEGFLFPATYEFVEETTAEELVEMQLGVFEREWAKVNLNLAKSKNLTPYEVLIIASMIEKEVVVPRERRLVAAVIYNRLEDGLALGIDATIRYGLRIPPTEAILQSQLESENPYNTRVHTGLPPTPISNPGLASMQAAARPAEVDYVYYIRKADCQSHFFTASEEEFQNYPRDGLNC